MGDVFASIDNKSNIAVIDYGHESLTFHVRGAVSSSLHEHEWFLQVLLHEDKVLVDQVIQGADAKEVSVLAEWLLSDEGGGQIFSAAILYAR